MIFILYYYYFIFVLYLYYVILYYYNDVQLIWINLFSINFNPRQMTLDFYEFWLTPHYACMHDWCKTYALMQNICIDAKHMHWYKTYALMQNICIDTKHMHWYKTCALIHLFNYYIYDFKFYNVINEIDKKLLLFLILLYNHDYCHYY